MKFPSAKHPIWGILEKLTLVLIVFVLSKANATNFDHTELNTIGGTGAVALAFIVREAINWIKS